MRPTSSSLGRSLSGAPTRLGWLQPGGSQGRKSPRGIAAGDFPRPEPIAGRSAAACSEGDGRADPSRRGSTSRAPRESIRQHEPRLPQVRRPRRGGPVGSARPLSDAISEGSKTAPARSEVASARFRHQPSRSPAAQPMLYRRSDHPSRRQPREHRRAGAVFPRREAGGPSRPAVTARTPTKNSALSRVYEMGSGVITMSCQCSQVTLRSQRFNDRGTGE
jgi:hypothetical protein